ncbi:hypothetical protein SCOCK_250021 [Actinacidiphila cocklensis]|uniref:Uncharacterized protein n=1 Tax=Actinacidiphila cocklensis TaxID=887465 RepID=A0A9W4GRA2_9ACTN|nr:hypothetical protein SCOCK_250021 [Actinacidiphila cocklensis]
MSMPKRTRSSDRCSFRDNKRLAGGELAPPVTFSRRSGRRSSNADQPFVPLGERYGPQSPANRPAYGQRCDLHQSRKRKRVEDLCSFRSENPTNLQSADSALPSPQLMRPAVA